MKIIGKILFVTMMLWLPLSAMQPTEETRGAVAFELFDETVVHEELDNAGMFKELNVTVFIFKTSDTEVTIDNIKKYDHRFKPLDKNEKLQDENLTLWIKVNLGKNFPSGDFVASYGDSQILEHSFLDRQRTDIFKIGGTEHLKFSYNKAKDSSIYYFKISSSKYENAYRYLFISSKNSFYTELNNSILVTISLGMIMGLIFMAGLYNGAMYYYNKDKSFLYYMLMQFFVTLILFNMTGIISFTDLEIARSETYYSLCSLMGVFFTTLFTKSFLDTKIHSPKLNTLLNIFIIMIFIDALFSIFYVSIIFKYHLLPFFALSYIYLAFKRVKQGFKPAIFYLLGWIFLVLSLFLDSFWQLNFIVSPIFVGTAIEAILFSFALSYKIKMINEEKEQQKELMVHQSKLASMGEMIGNIAHQWRQPLTHLSYTVMNIEDAFKHKSLDEVYLDKKVDEANTQIAYMSQTIDDFKDFYAISKEKELFSLEEESRQVLSIMEHALNEKDIEVEFVVTEDRVLTNYKNEYKQVLLNLLSNAKDALVKERTVSPKIVITVNKNSVSISDNAGGVKLKEINKIFEPYFTTKEEHSGIGLYMSKMIVEKNMGGKLSVRNEEEGAKFTIVVS